VAGRSDIKAQPGTPEGLPARFSPGPPGYAATPLAFQPALSIEESHRRRPHQARELLEQAMGTPLAWYASVSDATDQGFFSTFEYFILGRGGFGHLDGHLLSGRLWRVNFRRLAADLTRARCHGR
jgi:hypothetical protein